VGFLKMGRRVRPTPSPSRFFHYTSDVKFIFIKILLYTLTFKDSETKYISNEHAYIYTQYIYTYINIYIPTYVRTYTHIYVYTLYTHSYLHTYIYSFRRMYI
jgi:hypothetical protein